MNDREKAALYFAENSQEVPCLHETNETQDHCGECGFLAGSTWQLEQRPRECLAVRFVAEWGDGGPPCNWLIDQHHELCPMAGRKEGKG